MGVPCLYSQGEEITSLSKRWFYKKLLCPCVCVYIYIVYISDISRNISNRISRKVDVEVAFRFQVYRDCANTSCKAQPPFSYESVTRILYSISNTQQSIPRAQETFSTTLGIRNVSIPKLLNRSFDPQHQPPFRHFRSVPVRARVYSRNGRRANGRSKWCLNRRL